MTVESACGSLGKALGRQVQQGTQRRLRIGHHRGHIAGIMIEPDLLPRSLLWADTFRVGLRVHGLSLSLPEAIRRLRPAAKWREKDMLGERQCAAAQVW